MKSKILYSVFAAFLAASPARSSITVFAEYHLGEPGSLGTNNRPLDSSGNGNDITNDLRGSTTSVATTGIVAPFSTACLNTAGADDQGFFGGNVFGSLPTDNIGISIYARAASMATSVQGDVFTTGGSTGALKLVLGTKGWGAGAHNVAWIGGTNGVVNSFSANNWVHLALIRLEGVTTFYIDGIAQPSPWSGTPVNDTPHFSVNPLGKTAFDGQIDEARVVTFTSGETAANVLNALQGIPEPSVAMLGGLGLLGLLRRRRA